MRADDHAVDAASDAARRAEPWDPHRWSRHDPQIALAVAALALAPFLVTLVASLGVDWRAAGDWAVIELRSRDVGTSLTPWLGPYSRYGWNHPGPWFFWVLAVPYRLLGSQSWSLLAGAAAVNLAAAAAMLGLAWRRAGLAGLSLLAAGVAVVAANLPTGQLSDPWNPWLTLFPFGLVVVAAWAAFDGDRLGLAVTVGAGSFVVQSHVGFAVTVAGLGALAVAGTARRRRGERWWLVPMVVAIVAWLPVVIDQLFGVGNAMDLVAHFSGEGEDPLGWGAALEVASRELAGGLPPWRGGPEPVNPVGGGTVGREAVALVAPALVTAGAVAVGVWRRTATSLRLVAVLAVATVLGVASVARLTGEPFDYLLRWWWVIGMLWTVAVALVAWQALPERLRVPAILAAATLAVTVPASVTTIGAVDRDAVPNAEFVAPLAAIGPATVDALRAGDVDVVAVRSVGPRSGWLTDGVVDILDDAGIAVHVPDVERHKFGSRRASAPGEGTPELVVASGRFVDEVLAEPGAQELARWDPLAPAQRLERSEVEAELRRQLLAADRADLAEVVDRGEGVWEATTVDGVDAELVERLDELRRDGVPVATVLFR